MLKLFDKKEDVPDAQRKDAIETKDGKFAADIPESPDLGDKGKKALQAERERADQAEKDAKALQKKVDDLEKTQKARDAGITDDQLEVLRKEDAAKRKPIEDEVERLRLENRKLNRDDRVQKLALDSGVMKDRIKTAMKELDARVQLAKDGKELVVFDADGKITTEAIDTFLKTTFKKEFPWLYQGAGGSGSGGHGSEAGDEDVTDVSDATKQATKDAKRRDVAGAL